VGLTGSVSSDQEHVLGFEGELALRQTVNLDRVQIRQGGEVEVREGFPGREFRIREPFGEGSLLSVRDFGLDEPVQIALVRGSLADRVFGGLRVIALDARKAQGLETGFEGFLPGSRAHRHEVAVLRQRSSFHDHRGVAVGSAHRDC